MKSLPIDERVRADQPETHVAGETKLAVEGENPALYASHSTRYRRLVKQPAMVESGNSTLTEELQSVIDQALRSGMDAEAIARMVAERALTLNDVARNGLATDTPPGDAGDVFYEPGELPEGLIDLPSAADIYHKRLGTLRQWVQRGKLQKLGRMRGAAPGGYIVVSKRELEAELTAPQNKGGRPRKKVY